MKRNTPFFLFLTLFYPLSAQVVFPGDFNNDGIANHIDLLPLAVAYGLEGPPREESSLEWFPQPNTPWPGILPVSGVNLGFIDGDGNGFIDTFDLEAIPLNYDSLQMEAIPEPRPYLLRDTFFLDALPELILRFGRDSVLEGDTVRLSVFYEFPPGIALTNGPLGLAFTLAYDEALVQDSLTNILPNTEAGDLMFVAATTNFAGAWRSPERGQIEMAAAGRRTPALDRSRLLAEMLIIIEDMILLSPERSRELVMKVKERLLVNVNEQVVQLRIRCDTLTVYRPLPDATRQQSEVDQRVNTFPNPATDRINIEFTRPQEARLTILSPTGQPLQQRYCPSQKVIEWPIKGLPPGLYFLHIQTAEGLIVRRLVLER